jgi:Rrf2 family iron-sulfur cluster assembly transcriptional regulator
MRLTTKGRYAVTAMLDLAIHDDRDPVALAELVRSSRGPGGGYQLGRPAADIAVVDVIGAVDESVDATRCGGMENCQGEARCLTHDLWHDLSRQIHDFLGGIDLAQLVERRRVREVADRQDQVPVDVAGQATTGA